MGQPGNCSMCGISVAFAEFGFQIYPSFACSFSGSKSDGSGRRMREVACPTCTVHLQVIS